MNRHNHANNETSQLEIITWCSCPSLDSAPHSDVRSSTTAGSDPKVFPKPPPTPGAVWSNGTSAGSAEQLDVREERSQSSMDDGRCEDGELGSNRRSPAPLDERIALAMGSWYIAYTRAP
mmetsp:Transcript_27221/g.76431  ORF Transcript_27221/g.76431 Transcript_27221/m.76431 type:complete len:120 (+) Transcript_27221:143-502(+)|eukprot:scaffold154493_cov35-Tisochrysis_lutea.AAC.3